MSLYEEGLRMTLRHARARVGEEDDKLEAAKRAGAFEDVTLSNAVPGDGVGLPMYMTTSGTSAATGGTNALEARVLKLAGWSPFPEDGALTYFLAAALGIAIAGLPGWLLVSKLGNVKGHLAGAAVSGSLLTALWYWQKTKKDATTETKKPGDPA